MPFLDTYVISTGILIVSIGHLLMKSAQTLCLITKLTVSVEVKKLKLVNCGLLFRNVFMKKTIF